MLLYLCVSNISVFVTLRIPRVATMLCKKSMLAARKTGDHTIGGEGGSGKPETRDVYIYIYIYICVCVCLYIVYIYLYIQTCYVTDIFPFTYIYIYCFSFSWFDIYKYIEREREREKADTQNIHHTLQADRPRPPLLACCQLAVRAASYLVQYTRISSNL